jgi:hypothetical protein
LPTTPDRALPPGERVVARTALRTGAVLAVPAVAYAALVDGWSGAAVALVVIVVLAGGLAAVAWAVGRAAPHGPGAVTAAALGGSVLKLGLVIALLTAVPRDVVDTGVLAVTVVAALVILLSAAAWAVLRQPDAWWLESSPSGNEHALGPGPGADDRARDADDGRTTR